MPHRSSLLYSLQPDIITESEDGSRNVDLYTLGDAKDALSRPDDDVSMDTTISDWILTAQALIEQDTGMNFVNAEVMLEFSNPGLVDCATLAFTESDFIEVKEVYDVSAQGANALVPGPYRLYRVNGRKYFPRSDGKFFREGVGIVASALAVRGVKPGTKAAYIFRGVMDMAMREFDKGIGMTNPGGFMENPTYIRARRLLESNSATPIIF